MRQLAAEQKQLVDRYVKPYIWEGRLTIDGGWGRKNAVQEFLHTEERKKRKPLFFMAPNKRIVEIPREDGTSSSEEVDYHYQVSFPGKHFPELLLAIDTLRAKCPGMEQVWVLRSYVSTFPAEVGSPVYRLVIHADDEGVRFRVVEGRWIPSFDAKADRAGWEL